VDIAMECTGIFTDGPKAALHLQNGSKRVLVSAPVSGDGMDDGQVVKTIVYGVNHDTLDDGDHVVSNASCTTNCLAPGRLCLNEAVGIERGLHDHDPQLHRATSRRSTRCTRTSTAPARRR
jgi:glyceraldehyde 3-phosphate dehydrogenase